MDILKDYPIEEVYKYLARWNVHFYYHDLTENWYVVDKSSADSVVNKIQPDKNKNALARAAILILLD